MLVSSEDVEDIVGLDIAQIQNIHTPDIWQRLVFIWLRIVILFLLYCVKQHISVINCQCHHHSQPLRIILWKRLQGQEPTFHVHGNERGLALFIPLQALMWGHWTHLSKFCECSKPVKVRYLDSLSISCCFWWSSWERLWSICYANNGNGKPSELVLYVRSADIPVQMVTDNIEKYLNDHAVIPCTGFKGTHRS